MRPRGGTLGTREDFTDSNGHGILTAVHTRATRELAKLDPVLAKSILRSGPCGLKPKLLSPHESLTRAIVFQQLNGKAAETILGRFLALFGDSTFPTPAQILAKPLEDLRSAGLSRGKAAYIRNIAEHCVAGSMPSLKQCASMSDEEIIENLTVIKGVGRWTAEMFLIFNLGRPDVLPVHDFGVRKGYQILFGKRTMPTPKSLEKYGRKWAPYRSLAAWYLWRATDGE